MSFELPAGGARERYGTTRRGARRERECLQHFKPRHSLALSPPTRVHERHELHEEKEILVRPTGATRLTAAWLEKPKRHHSGPRLHFSRETAAGRAQALLTTKTPIPSLPAGRVVQGIFRGGQRVRSLLDLLPNLSVAGPLFQEPEMALSLVGWLRGDFLPRLPRDRVRHDALLQVLGLPIRRELGLRGHEP